MAKYVVMPHAQNSNSAPDGPSIPLHHERHGHVTYSLFLKSEDYPHRPTRVLIACFVLTHMHPRKLPRSLNIELLQVNPTEL